MIPVTTLKDRKVALFGLGGSGFATARALISGGAEVTAWDDNPDSVAKAAAEGIRTEDLHNIDWSQQTLFVLSPGVPLTHPKPHWTVDLARAAGVDIVGDVELFVRERRAHAPDCPFIAITGTNGKSTTTALVAHILTSAGYDTQLGGNIGTAVLTLDPPRGERFYVVECSSYQIDLAPTLNPSAGILLNVTPDHLDRHGTMQHYADIKERLVAGSDVAIVGVDDSHSALIADRVQRAGVKVVRISRRNVVADGIYAEGTKLIQAAGGAMLPFADLDGIQTLRGSHNAQNAAAAVAACLAVGVSADDIRAGLASFPGLKHRMQPVGQRGRVVFINDSKATNADAAAPALSSYDRIYWIAGGLPKAGGITTLAPYFPRIAKAYLIGEAAAEFAATLGEAVPYEISGTLERAVAHAAADADRDESSASAVMLSPACASFDQYKNFEVRGDAFVGHVAALDGIAMLIGPATGEK
ncbi:MULTISPECIES: UDP-N-acetylmuramoyl-L-alanine--D-glutamate ligase [Rhizobium]|jgi:UDP-N-acetylmuramoylalanine--D-glutamate ligase|uniref:UDP-N-acetylmuramoyl-L-alanine--D-glutamate ligase n=2 Tax=Rhizobium/Agrobacterium group TaxID=227290 RepID=UPI00037B4664|nr:UDP-N-acetylmuramoyl-L-alanine--D-glutamate ligase [Rhizobium leguminosarum]MBA8835104.1 UDP-N-acetylmuramoylalanine--D-glutamate ligase [Rhizobium leguminosarum]MBY5899270.1 UDP-N-acetylmuramoyl-L-alanine--D-glutamate ligase [Rhizobium leguminosarum]MBY5908656.1 UDP-N-acetylmuramoyl-L-alanine--D-glutamate ligase [Rhizobium leguminosarum]MDH6270556.1 UDP-N-acetylmuramoylalanine--D-glutamate ligase [Rhizobium leguminosarum]MVO93425.1 UDP-N-acetylmuramoyl-L-alanine--D-glutamate ligase [Rhizob